MDKDPVVRETVGGLLAQLGYCVYRAGTLEEAHSNLERDSSVIDMVIVDGELPDAVLRERLRTFQAATRGGKVIYSMPLTEQMEPEPEMGLVVDGVVHKPFLIRNLAREIRTVLDRTDA